METKKHWAKIAAEYIRSFISRIPEYAETIVIVGYIINGLFTFAILFDVIDGGEKFHWIVGGIAIAYSAFTFMAMVHRGVKHQTSNRRKR